MKKILTPQEKRKLTIAKKKGRRKKIKTGVYYRNLGFIFLRQGKYKEAIESFEKALTYFPVDNIRFEWTLYNIGYCKYHQERQGL